MTAVKFSSVGEKNSFGGATASISVLNAASNIQRMGKNIRSATTQPMIPAENVALLNLRFAAISAS
ncbi:hypothetical protein D9M69_734450 [compost metagenome]